MNYEEIINRPEPPVHNSEKIEPAVTHLWGVGGMRVEWFVAKYKREVLKPNGGDPIVWYELANEIVNFWWLVDTTCSLSAATRGATHFSIASSNESMKIARHLESLCGVDPIGDRKKFDSRDFDFTHLEKEAA